MMDYAAHALNGATAFFVKRRLNKVYQQTETVSSEFQPMTTFSTRAGLRWSKGLSWRCVQMQQRFRVQILVSSDRFLVSLALVMTSCYMRNFGWCTVFSFQLFSIANEDTILTKSVEFAAVCLVFVVRRVSLISAYFSQFISFPVCFCIAKSEWWGGHWGRSNKHCGSPREGQDSCGSSGVSQPWLLVALEGEWLGRLCKGCGLSSVHCWFCWFVFTWAEGMGESGKDSSQTPQHTEGKKWFYRL